MSDKVTWRNTSATSKTYLGDAVYAQVDEFGDVVLTTENGICATNRIVMEPAVMRSLIKWLRSLDEKQFPVLQQGLGL